MVYVLITVLIVFVLFLVTTLIVLGLSTLIGWLITLISSFTLFEGAVLAGLSLFCATTIWREILGISIPSNLAPPSFIHDDDDALYEDYEDEIPPSQFYQSAKDKTWENWYRYMFANALYADFQTSPRLGKSFNEALLRDIAIRLADAAVESLKKKSGRTRQLRISKAMLQHEMNAAGIKPYDDEILDAAVIALNEELSYIDDEIREVIQRGAWDDRAEMVW